MPLRASRVRSSQLLWLTLALAALGVSVGCVPAPSAGTPATPNAQNGDPNSPNGNQSTPPTPPPLPPQPTPPTLPPVSQSSISGQLTVQTDETASSLTLGPLVPLAVASDAWLGTTTAAAPLGQAVLKDFSALVLRPAPTTPAAAGSSGSTVPGELLVTFDDTSTLDQRRVLLADAGMQLIECSPSGVCRTIPADVPAGDKSLRLRRAADAGTRLAGLTGVRCVEPNLRRYIARTPSDEYFPYQWNYTTIHLPEAWDMTVGSDNVIVAVVDTGILSHHPDIQGRIVAGYDFISDPASARDGDGRDPDPEDEGDLFGGPGQSSFHGTHVSGTIAAATDNNKGVAGGTWRTKVMPLRALGVDGGTSFDVAEAIRYAAGLSNVTGQLPARRADIINLSLVGSPGESPSSDETSAIHDAAAAGVIIVGAAGNDGSPLPAYPAAQSEVISVSAVDIQLQRADYSNYGPSIDLAAPGGFTGTDLNGDGFGDGVLSTGASDFGGTIKYEYVFANGTSMAAPHVCAVAALVLAANPSLSAAAVRDVLQTTARDLGPAGRDDSFGYGLVDAAAAVREAYRRAGATPPAAPSHLSLSNDNISFGLDLNDFRVQVANTGGALTIESVTTRMLTGTGWLSAQAAPVSTGASSTNITITVNRAGLSNGDYRGVVTVTATSLGPAAIDVLMSVGPTGQAIETIYVLAVDSNTHDTIGDASTKASLNYVYTISDLPAGSYVLYAGTDRNDDGYICEEGDLCGALPSRLEPKVITLGDNEQLTSADFSVARLVVQQQTADSNLVRPLRRLIAP